jgi:hypothetical protein
LGIPEGTPVDEVALFVSNLKRERDKATYDATRRARAFLDIDKEFHQKQLRRTAEKLVSLQQTVWSLETEIQYAHELLTAAGVPTHDEESGLLDLHSRIAQFAQPSPDKKTLYGRFTIKTPENHDET